MIPICHRPFVTPLDAPKWPVRRAAKRPNTISRHFSRQNGEGSAPKSVASDDPAILRDSPNAWRGNGKSRNQTAHFPNSCARNLRSKPLEFEGFGIASDLIRSNPDFNPVEFDGIRRNAIAIRQMRTFTARNLKQLEGGEP
jgi:hypothetical protein